MPQYLVRFDDICPTMNWALWSEVESRLDDNGIKPIVAVVPDNVDTELTVGPPCERFWDTVRRWRAKGWTIAMHGYQHRYVTADAGILHLNGRSEFAGLSRGDQLIKLTQAVQIFQREGIEPAVWVAPSHSFDSHTLAVLRDLGIRTISDGLSRFPYRDTRGMLWVPQQVWRFRNVPAGVWTVCFHHNNWTAEDLRRFGRDIKRFRSQITTLGEVCNTYSERRKTIGDTIFAVAMLGFIKAIAHLPRFPRRLASRVPIQA
jgi:predicted deacetylase